MMDQQIRMALSATTEPVHPDPAFASELLEDLRDELGFRPAGRSGASAARRRRRQRASLPGRLLLVAALALGGGAALLAVGGAWRAPWDTPAPTDPPNVCDLITPTELSAIEGAPVRLVEAVTRTQRDDSVSLACKYEYQAPSPGGGSEPRFVHLAITAFPDRAAAAAYFDAASRAYGRIPDLGDGATIFAPNAAYSALMVLTEQWILEIVGDRTGTYLDRPRAQQIAELLLDRL